MALDPSVFSQHSEQSNWHEATFRGVKAKLSYAAGAKDDVNKNGTLYVRYGDTKGGGESYQSRNDEQIEIHNDRVICVIERASESRIFSINAEGNEERPEAKLDVIDATSLPLKFVEDNAISAQYPYLDQTSSALANEDSPRFYVIISSQSGSCRAAAFYRDIFLPLLAAGSASERTHTKIVTTSSSTITEFAQHTLLKHANAGIPQTVLLLSGDGGIVDILNGLQSSLAKPSLYRSPTIGIVAMGTGNALAYSTGLSRDHTLGLRRFYQGTPSPLPTFTATFSPGSALLVNEGSAKSPLPIPTATDLGTLHGAVVCSWALHASIVADSDTATYRRHGSARFTMAARELLRPTDGQPQHEYKGRVSYSKASSSSIGPASETKTKTASHLHNYVLATLVSHLEPGFHISPASRPLDGQLRLLRIAAPISAEAVEEVLGRAFTDGSHVADGSVVEYERVDGLRIEMLEEEERWRRVCVDGKIVVVPEGGWVDVRMNKVEDSVLNIVA